MWCHRRYRTDEGTWHDVMEAMLLSLGKETKIICDFLGGETVVVLVSKTNSRDYFYESWIRYSSGVEYFIESLQGGAED